MFDAGFLEMLVIGVLALIVVGPERLPGLARKAGVLMAKARGFITSTKADIEKEIQAEEMKSMLSQQKKEMDELRGMMKNTQQSIHKSTDNIKKDLADTVSDVKSSVEK